MNAGPLQYPCTHIATPQEHDRDPGFLCCNAQPGQPCIWAARYDGLTDPPFHSDRIEAAANGWTSQGTLDPESFREAVLDSGLV